MFEKIALPNPSRLAWCMRDQGFTRADLADAAKVSDRVLEAALGGEDALTIVQLGKLAKALDKDVLFLLEPQAVDEANAHTPQFRTLANQKPDMSQSLRRLIERAEKQRETYLHLREELGDDSPVEAFNPPALVDMRSSLALSKG